MKIEFKAEKLGVVDYLSDQVYLASFQEEDDRLLFIINGEIYMVINLTDENFSLHTQYQLAPSRRYKNLKKISKLEIKAILEA